MAETAKHYVVCGWGSESVSDILEREVELLTGLREAENLKMSHELNKIINIFRLAWSLAIQNYKLPLGIDSQ